MRGFKYHKHLCPKIWDSENRMDQLVVQSLCMMAWDFVRYLQFLGVPIKQSDVLDIVVHGSVTNYYWDSKSDIDLAIVADLSNVEKWLNGGNLYAMMKAFARSWRRTKTMSVAGRNIDIKLIDKNREYSREYWTVGSVYSVLRKYWLCVPVRMSRDELRSIRRVAYKKYRVVMRQCRIILREKMSAEYIDAYLVNLQRVRVNAAIENHVQPIVSTTWAFKMVRNSGVLRKMRNRSKKLQSKNYSIY